MLLQINIQFADTAVSDLVFFWFIYFSSDDDDGDGEYCWKKDVVNTEKFNEK